MSRRRKHRPKIRAAADGSYGSPSKLGEKQPVYGVFSCQTGVDRLAEVKQKASQRLKSEALSCKAPQGFIIMFIMPIIPFIPFLGRFGVRFTSCHSCPLCLADFSKESGVLGGPFFVQEKQARMEPPNSPVRSFSPVVLPVSQSQKLLRLKGQFEATDEGQRFPGGAQEFAGVRCVTKYCPSLRIVEPARPWQPDLYSMQLKTTRTQSICLFRCLALLPQQPHRAVERKTMVEVLGMGLRWLVASESPSSDRAIAHGSRQSAIQTHW